MTDFNYTEVPNVYFVYSTALCPSEKITIQIVTVLQCVQCTVCLIFFSPNIRNNMNSAMRYKHTLD